MIEKNPTILQELLQFAWEVIQPALIVISFFVVILLLATKPALGIAVAAILAAILYLTPIIGMIERKGGEK